MMPRWIVLVVAAVVLPLLLTQGELLLGGSPQFAFSLAGSFLIHLASRPTRREIVCTVLGGTLLRYGYGGIATAHPYFGVELIGFAGFLGMASILVLTLTAPSKNDVSVLGTAVFPSFVTTVVGFILPITNSLSPLTFDRHLLAVDGTLGFQPSFVLGRILNDPLYWNLTVTLYYALSVPVALMCAANINGNMREVRRLLFLFGTMSVTGFCIYAICPATGPIYAFRDGFPLAAPQLSDIQLVTLSVPNAPRNAIPSLHLSAALLMFWNTWGMRKAYRALAFLFLCGTAFAVLALGEHYFVDIVVAVPFALMFHALFANQVYLRSRACTVLSCAGVVLAWLTILRFNVNVLVHWPSITRSLFTFTLIFSALVRHKLLPCEAALPHKSQAVAIQTAD